MPFKSSDYDDIAFPPKAAKIMLGVLVVMYTYFAIAHVILGVHSCI